MNVFFSRNTELLLSTLNHPAVYQKMIDDSCPYVNSIELDDDLFIAECHNNEQYMGCFLLEKKSDYHVDVHACLLPAARGKGREFGKMLMRLIFSETLFNLITVLAPGHNKNSENLAIKLGFFLAGKGKNFIINGVKVSSSLYVFHRGMLWEL